VLGAAAAAACAVVASVVAPGPAFAGGSITVTPSTGLSQGQSVTITGSGFTAGSLGNVVECNSDPNQPKVHLSLLGGVAVEDVPVGCIPPSTSRPPGIVTVKSDGTIGTVTFAVQEGTIGPPCGPPPDAGTCPTTDSAGGNPATDAAKYPCPPTAAQIAAGTTCQVTFGDQANDSGSVSVHFASEAAATTTTAPAPAATTATTAPPTAPSSGSLAATGPGTGLRVLAIAGFMLSCAGMGIVGIQARIRRLRRS
jgi:hypothetical protein